jgi:hypothetical protein
MCARKWPSGKATASGVAGAQLDRLDWEASRGKAYGSALAVPAPKGGNRASPRWVLLGGRGPAVKENRRPALVDQARASTQRTAVSQTCASLWRPSMCSSVSRRLAVAFTSPCSAVRALVHEPRDRPRRHSGRAASRATCCTGCRCQPRHDGCCHSARQPLRGIRPASWPG